MTSTNLQEASSIALQFIGFLVSDEERLERFSALSGMGLGDLKDGAENAVFQGFLLDYAMQDEALILSFAENHNISPEQLASARRALPGADHDL